MNVTSLFIAAAIAAGPQAAKDSGQQRVDAIWSAFQSRMATQNDVWFEDGEFPRVIQNLKVLHALEPKDYETATNLGWMLENVERWDEALAVYVNFRLKNPDNPDAAFPEANFYFMKRMYSKVPPLLEPTIKKTPRPHANSFRTLAHSYDRLGMYKDSVRVWSLYIKENPTDEAAKVNLSRVEKKIKTKPQ